MKPRPTTFTMVLCILALPRLAAADTTAFDRAMLPIFTEYATIHTALSGDTQKGVARAAKKIAKLASKVDPRGVKGKHAGHYRGLPNKLKAAATKLGKARGLAKQREAFKGLSRPMALWATMSRPAGVSVVFCSMAKGSWLQKEKKIANPYFGASMLRCGEVVSGAHKGHAGGHMRR